MWPEPALTEPGLATAYLLSILELMTPIAGKHSSELSAMGKNTFV